MISVVTNEMTGEVSFVLDGKSYRFHATLARLAEFQAQAKVTGMVALLRAVQLSDARIIMSGGRALCTSENFGDLEQKLGAIVLPKLSEAITDAVTAGMPKAAPGNGEATTAAT